MISFKENDACYTHELGTRFNQIQYIRTLKLKIIIKSTKHSVGSENILTNCIAEFYSLKKDNIF